MEFNILSDNDVHAPFQLHVMHFLTWQIKIYWWKIVWKRFNDVSM